MLQIEREQHGIKEHDYTTGLNKTLHHLANTSVALCEKTKGELLHTHFEKILELFKKSDISVKRAIANVYLYSLLLNTQTNPDHLKKIARAMPEELKEELQRYNVSGMELTRIL